MRAFDELAPTLAVHQARTAGKRARAGLALLSRADPAPVWRAVAVQTRDAARAIGPHRDADVFAATAALLGRDSPREGPVPVPQLSDAAVARVAEVADAARPTDPATARAESRRGFEAALHALEAAPAPHISPRALGRALRKSCAQARRRFQRSLRDPDNTEKMHDWRKATKRWTYQLSLFTPAWPEVVGAMLRELDALQGDLGAHHDWVVLQEHLEGGLEGQLGETTPPDLAEHIAQGIIRHGGDALARGRVVNMGHPRHIAGWLATSWGRVTGHSAERSLK